MNIVLTIFLSVTVAFYSFSQAEVNRNLKVVDSLILVGNMEGAIKKLTIEIAKNPKEYKYYDVRGYIALEMGAFEYAISDFTEGLELVEDVKIKSMFLSNRGSAYVNIGQFDKGKKDLESAIVLDSLNIGAYNNLGNVYDELGRFEDAIRLFRKSLSLDETQYFVYSNIGFTYQNMNKHEEAIKYFSKSLKNDPKDAFAYNNRGFSKLQLNDLSGAIGDINKSIELMSSNSYAYKNRALVYIRMKKKKPACKDLNKALELGFEKQYGNEVSKLLEEHCN